MVSYEFHLELSVVPGNVGIWVGVGRQDAVYVNCKPTQVKRMQKQLMDAYHMLAGQGASVTPEQVRSIATRPNYLLNPAQATSLFPLIYS